jgi:hypothetical protein
MCIWEFQWPFWEWIFSLIFIDAFWTCRLSQNRSTCVDPNTTLPPNRGFCHYRDFGTFVQDRSCLHDQTWTTKPPPIRDKKWIRIPIYMWIIVLAAGVVVIVLAMLYCIRRHERVINDQPPSPLFQVPNVAQIGSLMVWVKHDLN